MSAATYYDRETTRHTDGTGQFQTAGDQKNEREIIAALEKAWELTIRPFGAMCPVDCYAEQHGRVVCLLEFKSRTHASTKYATVFLNVRKWLALMQGSVGLGCDAAFVVKFTDGIFFISLNEVDAENHRMAGCMRRVKADNDIEPVIDVPVVQMTRLLA